MWLFELILVSLLFGVPLGFGLRYWDERQEKKKADQVKELEVKEAKTETLRVTKITQE